MNFKNFVPAPIRRALMKYLRRILWSIYFRKYVKIIYSDKMPDKQLIKRLVFAYGNPGFSV